MTTAVFDNVISSSPFISIVSGDLVFSRAGLAHIRAVASVSTETEVSAESPAPVVVMTLTLNGTAVASRTVRLGYGNFHEQLVADFVFSNAVGAENKYTLELHTDTDDVKFEKTDILDVDLGGFEDTTPPCYTVPLVAYIELF